MRIINDIEKFTYQLADMNILIKTKPYNRFVKWMVELEGTGKPDLEIEMTQEKLNYQKEKSGDQSMYNGVACRGAFLREVSEILPNKNSFLLHSATFDISGVGVAFAALSGTGKTTQMLNWQKSLGEKLTIVNGDKPIIRFFDKDFCEQKGLNIPEGTELGVPYAYGTPWNGKEGFGTNTRTILKHICFIERSDTNFVTKIEKTQAVERLMKQVYIPKNQEALKKTLELVNRLINSCELWVIHCNIDPESAKVAYETIFGR